MRVALVNPPWSFDGSIYYGCRSPHLPLELGYTKALLEQAGHEVLLLDGHLLDLTMTQTAESVGAFEPDMTVLTTAPTYLFWRCAPPELRVPAEFLAALAGRGGRTVAVGPHGSATPGSTLRRLGVGCVIRGECEEVVLELANGHAPESLPAVSCRDGAGHVEAAVHATSFASHPALCWPDEWIARHHHHHHRFDREPDGPGAEVEASRGCPYDCSLTDFRDKYRRRDLVPLLEEIDGLIRQGVTYLYFVDEIFLPQKALLEALIARPVRFGVQTCIDLWKPELLELLGRAGCVSIEAGIESLAVEGQEQLASCRLDTEALAALLIKARRHVPFVQANLTGRVQDDPALVDYWRDRLQKSGVWANEPAPLYPYPSSPGYRALWGEPDDHAWERAHEHYLAALRDFSDIQDERLLPLSVLEDSCCSPRWGRVMS